MSQDIQRTLMRKLLPEVQSESRFLSPNPIPHIPASTVFDAVREISDPPMTEEDFDRIADELASEIG